jgi:hypothetical protein
LNAARSIVATQGERRYKVESEGDRCLLVLWRASSICALNATARQKDAQEAAHLPRPLSGQKRGRRIKRELAAGPPSSLPSAISMPSIEWAAGISGSGTATLSTPSSRLDEVLARAAVTTGNDYDEYWPGIRRPITAKLCSTPRSQIVSAD